MKVGDVVYLKSGSPALTITRIQEPFGTITVRWFAKEIPGGIGGCDFPKESLTSRKVKAGK